MKHSKASYYSHLFLGWLFFMGHCAVLPAQNLVRRALFVGNSYTYYFNLPDMVATLAQTGGDSLAYDISAPGGATLTGHTNNPTTLAKLGSGPWDYVVLQEQSQRPALPLAQVQTQFFQAAYFLDSAFHHSNSSGRTVMYQTWGRENGDSDNCPSWPPVCTYEGMDSLLFLRYRAIADSLDAAMAPVGALWRELRALYPGIDLYDPDESHPSLAGSFAAACGFYAILFQKDPALSPYAAGLDTNTAGRIKRLARLVVFQQLPLWNVNPPVAPSFPLVINEVLFDPSNSGLLGDANGDGVYDQEADSFIELVNTGNVCYDASGLQIWDDTISGQLRYTVPQGISIPPSGALVIFGGGTPVGTFGGAAVLTASASPVGLNFNNSGEVIVVKDDQGVPQLTFNSDVLSDNPNESYTRNPDIVGAFEQHNDNTPLRYSPGTRIDGTDFGTASCGQGCLELNLQIGIANKYDHLAQWSPEPAATEYSFEFKKPSDSNYTVRTTTLTQTNVNFPGPGVYEVRVGALVNGVYQYSCVENFTVDCFPVNAGIIVFKAPFCATSPVTYRVNYSGGVGTKTFLWSTGATTRSITVAPGTYQCTVSDAYGCDTTVSISSSAPSGSFESTTLVSVVKSGANFTVNWNPKSIPGAMVLGYRAGYRLQNSGLPFTNSPLLGGTSHVFNLSTECNGNYEFTVTVRYQYTGMPAATSAPACSISRGHNNGPCKGEGGLLGEDNAFALWVYPNPTQGFVSLALNGEPTSIDFLDLNGRVVLSGGYDGIQAVFDLASLAQGVYVIRVAAGSSVRSQRLVKQ